MIEFLEIDGYPPCIVMERGTMTLNQWMTKNPIQRNPFIVKSILNQVTSCGTKYV